MPRGPTRRPSCASAATVTLAAHLDKLADEGRLPDGVERPAFPGWLTWTAAQGIGRGLGEPALRECVGCYQRRDARGSAASKTSASVVPICLRVAPGRGGVVAARAQLDRDVDDPAGADDEVGRPQDPRSASSSATASSVSWLFAGPGDRAATQPGHDVRVSTPPSAQGERTSTFAVRARAGRGPACAEPLGDRALGRIDVADDELRAGAGAARGNARADVAEADDGDRAAAQGRRAEQALAGGAQRSLDAERGEGAGVARAAAGTGEPGHVAVRSAIVGMSRLAMPTSSAVR